MAHVIRIGPLGWTPFEELPKGIHDDLVDAIRGDELTHIGIALHDAPRDGVLEVQLFPLSMPPLPALPSLSVDLPQEPDECRSCGCPFPENPCRYCGHPTRRTR